MEQLCEFDNFQYMLDYVKRSLRQGPRQSLADQAGKNKANKGSGSPAVASAEQKPIAAAELTPVLKDTLKYLFNILENVTSVADLRDRIDCAKLFLQVRDLFNDRLDPASKKSLINIMFNLNFKLQEPHDLSIEFL